MNNQLTAFNTLLFKEIKRIVRIWPQTLLPPVITMTLYFVIFGQMIGSRVGEMGGVSYMQFIVPGLIMMSVITNSYSNVVSSFLAPNFTAVLMKCWCRPYPSTPYYWVMWVVAYFVGLPLR